jgi:hypothetical protein
MGYLVQQTGSIAITCPQTSVPYMFKACADLKYGVNGLKQKELVAEYIMSVMTEAVTLALLLRAVWLVTMPKHLFVPYDQRNKRPEESLHEQELAESVKGRQAA